MKILIAGAGAVGGWLAARLLNAGADVTMLARLRLAMSVEKNGFEVRGETQYKGKPRVITRIDAETFDVIILTCKAYDTAQTAHQVAAHLAPTGIMVSLQNGLGNAEKLLTLLPPEQVAIALTSHGITITDSGRLVHAGTGVTKIGAAPGHPWTERHQLAHDLFVAAELDPIKMEDTRREVWTKVIVNAGLNPVAALNGVKNGEVDGRPDLKTLCLALVREAAATAKAAGVDIEADMEAVTIDVIKRTKENECSMLQDLHARRPTEIEQISGRILRVAQAHKVHTPQTRVMRNRLRQLEDAGAKADRLKAIRQAEDDLDIEV